jgi:hypothetical protein
MFDVGPEVPIAYTTLPALFVIYTYLAITLLPPSTMIVTIAPFPVMVKASKSVTVVPGVTSVGSTEIVLRNG